MLGRSSYDTSGKRRIVIQSENDCSYVIGLSDTQILNWVSTLFKCTPFQVHSVGDTHKAILFSFLLSTAPRYSSTLTTQILSSWSRRYTYRHLKTFIVIPGHTAVNLKVKVSSPVKKYNMFAMNFSPILWYAFHEILLCNSTVEQGSRIEWHLGKMSSINYTIHF